MGLTLPSRLGGTRKFPSQLAAPTLELKIKRFQIIGNAYISKD
jgi:hypothetical protein